MAKRFSVFLYLYCGKRSHIDLLRSQKDFKEEELRELATQLPKTLEKHGTLCKTINKKDYVPTFTAYETEHGDLLKKIDTLVFASPMELDETVTIVITVFLDALEEALQQDKRYHKKQGRPELLFEVKLSMALFLTPLTRKLELRMAESFCNLLNKLWLERYPGEIWYPGFYEDIIAGFRQRKLCFITTAVCAHEGKADDCMELTALRRFRDGWFRENGGADLIARYYDIAPTLVTLMDHCDDSHSCYSEIRTRWLEPCLSAIEAGQEELCRDIYVDMVQTLRRWYLQ